MNKPDVLLRELFFDWSLYFSKRPLMLKTLTMLTVVTLCVAALLLVPKLLGDSLFPITISIAFFVPPLASVVFQWFQQVRHDAHELLLKHHVVSR